MDERLVAELKEAEAAVAEAEKKLGPDHPDLADKLQRYANLLRQTETRKLDAVNIEARARAIRAKVYAEDEKAHGTTTITKIKKPVKASGPAIGMYFGIAGIFVALSSLFVTQTLIKFLLPLAVVLGLVDVAVTRSGFWRMALVLVFAVACWMSNESLPGALLVNESPINRFNYANENPEIVASAKKLSAPVQVLNYSICLPENFAQTADDKQDWGRVITWQPPTDENQVAPQLSLVLMKLPPDFEHKKGRADLFSITKDQVMPKISELFELSDVTEEPLRLVEINGVEYARATFNGRSNDIPRNGFAYVTVNKNILLVIAGEDAVTSTVEAVPLMDASVYTFRKLGAEDDTQIFGYSGDSTDSGSQGGGDGASQ